jgi:hypothetical protein
VSIPLTFDWATLAWLYTHFRSWWRGRAPAAVALSLLVGVSGCVPVLQLEESQSAAQVEQEGRRRSEAQLAQTEAENERLRAQMREEQQTLEEREQALSQAELDTAAQGKQRQDAEGMVEQLRGELARAGSHLQAFHDDKQKLEQSLSAEAAHGEALARLSRDVALSFSDALATGEYSLDTEQGALVLRLPSDDLLGDNAELKPDAAPTLEILARVMRSHASAMLHVEDSAAPADALRVAPVVAALGARGVAQERFQSPQAAQPASETAAPAPAAPASAAPAPAAAPPPTAAPEMRFAFSVP